MDASVAQRLAQGLKTHKRKDTSTSESVKKARTEGTSSTVPTPVAITVEVPSDAEPTVPRALSRSPPVEDTALKVHPERIPGVEGRKRKKTLAQRSRSHKVAVEGAGGSEEDLGENTFNNRDLIKRLVEGCILPEVVKRIVLADPELWV